MIYDPSHFDLMNGSTGRPHEMLKRIGVQNVGYVHLTDTDGTLREGDVQFIRRVGDSSGGLAIDAHLRQRTPPRRQAHAVARAAGGNGEGLRVHDAVREEGLPLRAPRSRGEGPLGCDDETARGGVDRKTAPQVDEVDLAADRHGLGAQRQRVIPLARGGGERDPAKGLVEPPGTGGGRHGRPVARNFVEAGLLDNRLEVARRSALDSEAVDHVESAVRRELCRDDPVPELDRMPPRVLLEAVFRKDEIGRGDDVDVGPRLAGTCDVDEVERQDRRRRAANLHRPGGGDGRGPGGGSLGGRGADRVGKEQQPASAGGKIERQRDASRFVAEGSRGGLAGHGAPVLRAPGGRSDAATRGLVGTRVDQEEQFSARNAAAHVEEETGIVGGPPDARARGVELRKRRSEAFRRDLAPARGLRESGGAVRWAAVDQGRRGTTGKNASACVREGFEQLREGIGHLDGRPALLRALLVEPRGGRRLDQERGGVRGKPRCAAAEASSRRFRTLPNCACVPSAYWLNRMSMAGRWCHAYIAMLSGTCAHFGHACSQ